MTDKKIIRGDNNFINEGIILNTKNGSHFDEKVMEILTQVDNDINNLFPEGIVSKTMNDKKTNFKCTKLIDSLSEIGIPLEVSLKIIENIHPEIIRIKTDLNPLKEFTTGTIRKAIVNSFYYLEHAGYDDQQISRWVTTYIRRYGNPDYRINVIQSDNSFRNLDHEFIRSRIIPEVISKIFNTEIDISRIISSKDISEMSFDILRKIKLLNINDISYKTIINLVKDLATQLPKPWIVSEPYNNAIVKFNLNSLAELNGRFTKCYENKEIVPLKHLAFEIADLLSSTILAYYGSFIGSSDLRALSNLKNVVVMLYNEQIKIKNIEQEKTDTEDTSNIELKLLLDNTKLDHLAYDLNGIGVDLNYISSVLSKVHRFLHMNKKDDENVSHLFTNIEKYYSIVTRLIENNEKTRRILAYLETFSKINRIDFWNLVLDIFRKIPQTRILPNSKTSDSFHLSHSMQSLHVKEIKSIISCHIVYSNSKVDLEKIKLRIEKQDINEKVCNTILLITNSEFSEDCYLYVANYPNKTLNILLMRPRDLKKFYDAKTKIDILDDLYLEYYDKLQSYR